MTLSSRNTVKVSIFGFKPIVSLGFKNNLISSGFKLVGESQKNENYGFNTLYENEKYKVMIVLSPLKWEIFVRKK